MSAAEHAYDDPAHFADCIDCHRRRYGRPGMTAGEFEPYLPEHLKQPYWRTKIDEWCRAEGLDPDADA
jgi:hypothetical protein